MRAAGGKSLRVLITVKTYPIPSAKYDELSCTAGVTEEGEFIRLYPINYRDLPWGQQFKKFDGPRPGPGRKAPPGVRRS